MLLRDIDYIAYSAADSSASVEPYIAAAMDELTERYSRTDERIRSMRLLFEGYSQLIGSIWHTDSFLGGYACARVWSYLQLMQDEIYAAALDIAVRFGDKDASGDDT